MRWKRLLLAMTLVLVSSTVASASIKMVSVSGNKVNLRSGPGTNYAIIWELGKGYPLRVLETRGDWLRVGDFENDEGWIYHNLVGREPHLIVKKTRVNLRSGPGTKFRIVGQANYGVVFKTMESKSGWVKVMHENGVSGWVERSLLWGW